MRVFVTLMLCALAMPASGWARGSVPAPPTCADAGSRPGPSRPGLLPLWTARTPPSPGHPLLFSVSLDTSPGHKLYNTGHPLYSRFCSPAKIFVRLRGTSFHISGGSCKRGWALQVGLLTNPPAAPAEFVTLLLPGRPGTVRIIPFPPTTRSPAVLIQLRGPALAISGGTITVGQTMHAGTFALRLDDGTPVTGSWTCG